MKRWMSIVLLLVLLLVGCRTETNQAPTETGLTENRDILTEEPESLTTMETSATPEMLIGVWRSLDPGELDMIETIELSEDGSISVNCVYQGRDAGTIYGTYYVVDDVLHCDMTANGAPYILDYRFQLDGRELLLQDDDGPAHYIKVS